MVMYPFVAFAGGWDYEIVYDRINGQVTPKAKITSIDSEGRSEGTLYLTCGMKSAEVPLVTLQDKSKTKTFKTVILELTSPDFYFEPKEKIDVTVRLDDDLPFTKHDFALGAKTVVINSGYSFYNDLTLTNTIGIRVKSWSKTLTWYFSVSDVKKTKEEFLRNCPQQSEIMVKNEISNAIKKRDEFRIGYRKNLAKAKAERKRILAMRKEAEQLEQDRLQAERKRQEANINTIFSGLEKEY